jgi:hypothetical protein
MKPGGVALSQDPVLPHPRRPRLRAVGGLKACEVAKLKGNNFNMVPIARSRRMNFGGLVKNAERFL